MLKIAGESERHENQQRDDSDANVQAVKAGEREKCGREQIGIDQDAFVKNAEIFPALAKNKNGSEQNCQREIFRPAIFFPRARW